MLPDWISGNRLLFLGLGLLVGFVLTSAMWVYIIDKKDYLGIGGIGGHR